MTLLVNIATLLILGVYQVSSYEGKDIQIAYRTYSVNCFENANNLSDKIDALVRIVKRDLAFKEQTIQSVQDLVTAVNQCCGSQSEEKCLQTVLKLVRIVAGELRVFSSDYMGPLLAASTNISLQATYTRNEVDCCSKLQSCKQKYEVPAASYNGSIKVCKADCTCALNNLMIKIPGFIGGVTTAAIQQANFIKACEDFRKLKAEVLKDGKCTDEKNLSLLSNAVGNLQFLGITYLTSQTASDIASQDILAGTSSVIGEFLRCPI